MGRERVFFLNKKHEIVGLRLNSTFLDTEFKILSLKFWTLIKVYLKKLVIFGLRLNILNSNFWTPKSIS